MAEQHNQDPARVAQCIEQCRAVSHMARAIARVNDDYAAMFQAGHALGIVEIAGGRSAAIMEDLGNLLNGMEAVTEDDAWMAPIFAGAHAMWPAQKGEAQPAAPTVLDEIAARVREEADDHDHVDKFVPPWAFADAAVGWVEPVIKGHAPGSERRRLIIGAALLIAEIERLDRAEARAATTAATGEA